MRYYQSMNKEKSKSTVLIIVVGLLIIHLLSELHIFLYVSLTIGVLGLSDKMSQIIDRLWMGLSKILSYIIPNILLTLVFYLILFPFALIQRITQDDPLRLSPNRQTFWIDEEGEIDPESFEKTW